MNMGDIEFGHIVDVDGQLLGIDAAVVDARSLLRRARRDQDRQVFLIRAGERMAIGPKQCVRLTADEVLFFETVPAPAVERTLRCHPPARLAA